MISYEVGVLFSAMDDESFAASGTEMTTFGFIRERNEAESPLAIYVNHLNRSSAVRTRSRSCVPSDHPLVLITHEHQTHPSSSSLLDNENKWNRS